MPSHGFFNCSIHVFYLFLFIYVAMEFFFRVVLIAVKPKGKGKGSNRHELPFYKGRRCESRRSSGSNPQPFAPKLKALHWPLQWQTVTQRPAFFSLQNPDSSHSTAGWGVLVEELESHCECSVLQFLIREFCSKSRSRGHSLFCT